MQPDPCWTRNRILFVLYRAHPDAVEDNLLRSMLERRGCVIRKETLRSELYWLRDSPRKGDGYIELTAEDVPGTDEVIYKSRIMPLGINLIEGFVKADPAVTPFDRAEIFGG